MISEKRFLALCEEIIQDREFIRQLNPSLNTRSAILWMLLGSLTNLLSISPEEQATLFDPAEHDPYLSAVLRALEWRTRPPFNAKPHLVRLLNPFEG